MHKFKNYKKKKDIFRRRREEKFKINDRITSPKVRLVGDNIDVDIYPLQRALEIANQKGLDLVEISPNSDPPVC